MGMLWFLLLNFCVFAAGATGFETYSYRYAGKEIQSKVAEVDGVKVNDLCFTDQKKCGALKAYRGVSKFNSLKNVKQGNFAGAYCELLGGTQLFAARGKVATTQFCVFSDLTFIDAKALYEAHNRKFGGKK
jgi:hypothetical protein